MNYKAFQREDLARIACTDGAVLGWEQGLGKTIALYTIPLLKCGFGPGLAPKAPVLLVAPANLIGQLVAEGAKLFGISVTHIEDQAAFAALPCPLPPGFYITSFTSLAINGSDPKLHTLMRDAFECVVVDEGTRIQKDSSMTSEAVCSLKSKYRFLLTGRRSRTGSDPSSAWRGGPPAPASIRPPDSRSARRTGRDSRNASR